MAAAVVNPEVTRRIVTSRIAARTGNDPRPRRRSTTTSRPRRRPAPRNRRPSEAMA